jgi:hypothetical protein
MIAVHRSDQEREARSQLSQRDGSSAGWAAPLPQLLRVFGGQASRIDD